MASLNPMAVWGLVKEARSGLTHTGPLVVSGPLAEQLARQLGEGAAPGAVRTGGSVQGAAALIRILGGAPTEEDERELRAANLARVPVLAVQTSGAADVVVPYVLPTDVVVCPPGAGFPVAEIARALAARLGDRAVPLTARLPVLRDPVCDHLIESFARKNAILGVAIFVPGADFPVLTLNQIRLVLRLAAAHGVELDQSRLPEVLATIGAGLGFRAVARQLLGVVPVGGWAVKGGIAYTGTRSVGAAAREYFALRAAPTQSARI